MLLTAIVTEGHAPHTALNFLFSPLSSGLCVLWPLALWAHHTEYFEWDAEGHASQDCVDERSKGCKEGEGSAENFGVSGLASAAADEGF